MHTSHVDVPERLRLAADLLAAYFTRSPQTRGNPLWLVLARRYVPAANQLHWAPLLGNPDSAERVGADLAGEAGACGAALDHLECGGACHRLILQRVVFWRASRSAASIPA